MKKSKSGRRKDLNNQFFRSSWEANFARYLNFLKKTKNIYKWEYEPDTFWFEGIKRGTRSYLPDFKVWDRKNSEPYYYEIKGWMDKKSATQLKRMAKYYPAVKIVLIEKLQYDSIRRQLGRAILQWE